MLAGVLILAVPLFVRAPVWVDVTYHDISAWNIRHGGVHYRDIFETNLPGMVWVHLLLRPLIGPSSEAIRLADLAVFGLIVFLLGLFVRASGRSRAAQIWLAVACSLFYLFETEYIHAQRDGWMMAPALMAVWHRHRLIQHFSWWRAVAEGLLWGAAVWIKPHVLVPALMVWLVSWNHVSRRDMLRSTGGVLVGGLLAGAAGSAWLIATGAWRPMWDVLLNWNGEYYDWSLAYLTMKVRLVFVFFSPFSLAHHIAIPLALLGMFRRRPELAARGLLGAMYLGWLAQATLIQKHFDYAHSPPTLLALAVLACYRIPVGPVFLVWCLAGSEVHQYARHADIVEQFARVKPATFNMAVPDHKMLSPAFAGNWRRAWSDDSLAFKDELSAFRNIHCVPDWEDLGRVAGFLREKKVGDRDLICWHDSTHPLYLWLDVRPGLRYPHVITAMRFKSKLPLIRTETLGSPAKYVVADLVPCGYLATEPFPPAPPAGLIDRLPDYFPAWGPSVYPWNQKPVYRAGRYFVFEITHPAGDIDFPWPED